MKTEPIWKTTVGDGRLIAVALHDGSAVRPELEDLFAIGKGVRRREEDPYTGDWTSVGDIRILGTHSRFQVDLNRSRAEAVYRRPEDAWGLQVWATDLPEEQVRRSLAEYDAFYAALYDLLKDVERRHGRFFVYDLHSYNHRRAGPSGEPADPEQNPEVNIGTGTMDRARWGSLLDRFINDLRTFDFRGRCLDVRENVKFVGRGFPRFVHEHFPETGCAVAIEFKKFWMDEWTGELYPAEQQAIIDSLQSTAPGIREELARMDAAGEGYG